MIPKDAQFPPLHTFKLTILIKISKLSAFPPSFSLFTPLTGERLGRAPGGHRLRQRGPADPQNARVCGPGHSLRSFVLWIFRGWLIAIHRKPFYLDSLWQASSLLFWISRVTRSTPDGGFFGWFVFFPSCCKFELFLPSKIIHFPRPPERRCLPNFSTRWQIPIVIVVVLRTLCVNGVLRRSCWRPSARLTVSVAASWSATRPRHRWERAPSWPYFIPENFDQSFGLIFGGQYSLSFRPILAFENSQIFLEIKRTTTKTPDRAGFFYTDT